MKNMLSILVWMSFGQLLAQPLPSQKGEEKYWAQEKIFVHTDKAVYVVGETLWFSLFCVDKFSQIPSHLSKVAYLEIIDGKSPLKLQEKVTLNQGLGTGQFYLSPDIPSGIYRLRAYTSWMRNEGPNAFFQQEICIVNPQIPPQQIAPAPPARTLNSTRVPSDSLAFFLSQKTLSPREKVILTLPPISPDMGPAYLSLSIHKIDKDVSFPKPTIGQMFSSKGQAPPRAEESVSNLMAFPFLPESQTHILQGEFLDKSLSEHPVFLSIPGKAAEIYSVQSDDEGRFSLSMAPNSPSGDIFFWSPQRSIGPEDLRLFSPFAEAAPAPPKNTFPGPEWRELLESYIYNAQVSYLYRDSLNHLGKPSASTYYTQAFYGIPRFRYLLDDYTRFPELEEVFLEYVRYALKKKIDGKRYVFVWDEYTNLSAMGNAIPFDRPALVMIDGIPIKDPDILWDFNVFDIKQIDLVTKKYYVKDHTFYGIANFLTYDHDFGGKKLPEDLLPKTYSASVQAKTFTTPHYTTPEQKNRPIPDFRSTLYWNPSLVLGEQALELAIWSSDDEGLYKVEINGISSNGMPLYGEAYLEVSRKL